MSAVLQRGEMVRDFAVRVGGAQKWISDYRGRRNLVLVFAGESREQVTALLDGLARERSELDYWEAQVVVIGNGGEDRFAVAAEESSELRARYGAERAAAVVITDRYGEIMFAAREGDPWPSAAEVIGWLEYIVAQCPE